MSHDISVTVKCGRPDCEGCGDCHYLDINWLRNPFGLCSWAEDNVGDGRGRLWHVCNDWAYERAKDIRRDVFRDVVHEYAGKLAALTEAFFAFDLPSYRQFIQPRLHSLPTEGAHSGLRIRGERYNGGRLMLPVEHFRHGFDLFITPPASVLEHYRRWFGELVAIADLLQDPRAEFYCSN